MSGMRLSSRQRYSSERWRCRHGEVTWPRTCCWCSSTLWRRSWRRQLVLRHRWMTTAGTRSSSDVRQIRSSWPWTTDKQLLSQVG